MEDSDDSPIEQVARQTFDEGLAFLRRGPEHFDQRGERLDFIEFMRREIHDPEWRRVRITYFKHGCYLSTVLLPTAAPSFRRPGRPPLIFETAWFGYDGVKILERYTNRRAARKTHKRILKLLGRMGYQRMRG